MNRISDKNNDLSNNQKFVWNKGYYFNYWNDESFNKLNEQNIYPIDIKYNSKYKIESTNYLNKDDNFDYKANFYMNDLTKKDNSNKMREILGYNRINENLYNYKEYLSECNKTEGISFLMFIIFKKKLSKLINKNVFNSMNINYNTNPKNTYNNYNSNEFRNNLRSDSGFKLNHRKLNLNYDDNAINDVNANVNMQANKLNVNNEPTYDIEKRYNIKTYFQLN